MGDTTSCSKCCCTTPPPEITEPLSGRTQPLAQNKSIPSPQSRQPLVNKPQATRTDREPHPDLVPDQSHTENKSEPCEIVEAQASLTLPSVQTQPENQNDPNHPVESDEKDHSPCATNKTRALQALSAIVTYTPNTPDDGHHVDESDQKKQFSGFSVHYQRTDDPLNTQFRITSGKVKRAPSSRKNQSFTLSTPRAHKNHHWALFRRKRNIYHLCRGYFMILEKEDTTQLNAFLHFVHDPRIKHYLGHEKSHWKQDICIDLNGESYTLKFFNGKGIKQCQAFHILKHKQTDDNDAKQENDKAKKSQKIYALYFPEPNSTIHWKWHDTKQNRFVTYDEDDEQTLQFEASYYANNPDNFPISNPLFRSKLSTSIFDHCYLSRFSKLLSQKTNQSAKYCMRYTLNVTGDHGEHEIVMDQLQTRTKFARTVIRYFDRQEYLKSIWERIGSMGTRQTDEMPPMMNELGSQNSAWNTLEWIGQFEVAPAPPIDNTYRLNIKQNKDKEMSTNATVKLKQFSHATIHCICVKEGELITNRCKDFMWARFKKKKSSYCDLVNGYWDVSFDKDDKYQQLREHLDAILTVLQHTDAQDHILINTRDGSFLTNEEDDEKGGTSDKVLRVTIGKCEYELIWYNTLPVRLKTHHTHAVCIKCIKGNPLHKNEKMFIMYFPKPIKKWQWYDNNACEFKDYQNENELLQLECSYLANVPVNYPKTIIRQSIQQMAVYFSHCKFTALQKNLKAKNPNSPKQYVLRYEVIPESQNKLLIGQLAYSGKDDFFPREIQRITDHELQIKKEETALLMNVPSPHRTVSTGNTFDDVVQRLTAILIDYQQWQCLISDLKQPGMISRIEAIYDECESKNQTRDALVKLQDDFNSLMKRRNQNVIKEDEGSYDEWTQISDQINAQLTKLGHKSTSCFCVERTYRDRSQDDIHSKERYFGFSDPKEIMVQQMLDSYHCTLVHLYDIESQAITRAPSDSYTTIISASSTPMLTPPTGDSLHGVPLSSFSLRTSSLLMHTYSSLNRKKFNTYDTYDNGIRFYYWKYYEDNQKKIDKYQDRVADPGNGKSYRFCDWYIVPEHKDLKEEILAFGNETGSHIGKGQFDVECSKASTYLKSEQGRQLRCETDMWETRYGICKGDAIKHEHILAIRFYCCFSKAVDQFIQSFIKKNETDDKLKKRHAKCALWSKYLRECVEGFGTRLQNVRGVPCEYYRGITKKFLFRKTILRFNSPTSTSVSKSVAVKFASEGDNGDGLVLKLKPHWGDYGGYIRAMSCIPFTDFQFEEEYLFIGGLEPLVIHNITEISGNTKSYLFEIQSMNNILQIFEGMACKFKMRPKLIARFLNNRLNPKKGSDDYMSQIFDFYCDDLRAVTIKLSLMDKSYKSIASLFMDSFNGNALKLMNIVQLFPNCERVTLCDGYNYQLMPKGVEYEHTILGVIGGCLDYVQKTDHPLNRICLESQEEIDEGLWNKFKTPPGTVKDQQNKPNDQQSIAIGWSCEQRTSNDIDEESSDEQDVKEFKYVIKKTK